MTPLLNIIDVVLADQERKESAAEAVLQVIRLYFSDPAMVHINMLQGALAKPTRVQIMHLYPEFGRAVALLSDIVGGEETDANIHLRAKQLLGEIDA